MQVIGMLVCGGLMLTGTPVSAAAFQKQPLLAYRVPGWLLHKQQPRASSASSGSSGAPSQEQENDHARMLAARGSEEMGFDQQAATHHFVLTRSGGRIEITANDPADAETIRRVVTHLMHIARRFAEGDFSAPRSIHGLDPPGAEAMKRLKARIHYQVADLPAGGVLRISSVSQEAIDALHAFLRFQIREHRTGDPFHVTIAKR